MTASGSTLVAIPVLGRPHRVEPLAESVAAATPEPHRVLFVATAGDRDEIAALRSAGVDWIAVDPNPVGDYARKINHAVAVTDDPYIFTGADDLAFRSGWLTAALTEMTPDGVGVVGTNDLSNERVIAGEHATHFLVARWYVDRFGTIDEPGKIFHEGYPHEFVDDELIATARLRGRYAHAAGSLVEHLHPLYGKAPTDALYDAHAERMRAGRRVFRRRRHLWANPNGPRARAHLRTMAG